MRKLFYIGVVSLALFEAASVYFIMPMPGSQRMHSIDLAHFLYSWRWLFRAVCTGLMLAGARSAWSMPGWRRAMVPAAMAFTAIVAYVANFMMSADHMFLQPASLSMQPVERNAVDKARLVVGIAFNGDARAYPIQFIGYHHQVRDSVGGRAVMVSYCTVCRTGRVFAPVVDGHLETFRLVGMDHFNAMFEDRTTGSWWRQASGEAVAGPRTGAWLAELPSQQLTLGEWLTLHPGSLIMQPDSTLQDRYAKSFDYETGASRSSLTGTDTIPWHEKAWVVGVAVHGESKAYDWNRLRHERVVNDEVGGTPIVLVLTSDTTNFFAFERPDAATHFVLRTDSLVAADRAYALSGQGNSGTLRPLSASQEFWHSWRTFHPATLRY
jgi:hypothetical protein